VFVLPGRGRAGGLRVPVIQSNLLKERGHDVRIYYHRKPFRFVDGYRYVNSHLFRRDSHDWVSEFRGEAKGFRNIEQCVFDDGEIIIGIGMWASLQLGKLANLGNPKIQYIHGQTSWDVGLMKETLKLPYPKIIIAEYLRNVVSEYDGGNVLALIYNGVDKNVYYRYRDQEERDGFGMIYQRHPAKDPDTMNRIIDRFSKEYPEIPIRCFGFGDPPRGIRKENYRRYPSVDAVREMYNHTAVWVVPSRTEGFSLVILEAMACGCAVVATDCGAAREVIDDGENGFLVNVGDTQGIADKVRLLLGDRGLRRRIGRNALETVGRFTWERNVTELERAMEMVASP